MSSQQSLDTESQNLTYQQMIIACQTANLIHLRKLVSEDLVNKVDGCPAWRLQEAAVKSRNSSILKYLLQAYPETDVKRKPVLKAAFAHPDLKTFKVLHIFDPSIVTYEFELNLWATAFLESCRFGDPTIPNYLLENGADPDEGGFGGASVLYMLGLGQPDKIFAKMIEKGVRIHQFTLHNTIKIERLGLLKLFTREADERMSWNAKEALEVARETKNEKVIMYLEKWFEKREIWIERRATKRMREERTEKEVEGQEEKVKKRWWKFWRRD